MKRKILSVVIALAMMLTLLPTVFATVEDVGTGSVHISVANGTGGDEGKVLLTITTTDAFTADDNIYYAVFTDLAWTNSGTWAGFEQDNTVLGEKKMELGKVSHTYTEDITAMVQCSSEVDDSFDSYVWEMYRDQIFYPDEWNARYDNVYD